MKNNTLTNNVLITIAIIGLGLTVIDLTPYHDMVNGSIFELDNYEAQYNAFISRDNETEFQEVVATFSFDTERYESGSYRSIYLISISFPNGEELYYDDEFNENKIEIGKKVNLRLYNEKENTTEDYVLVISDSQKIGTD